MKEKSASLMQSEIFIIIMIVMILLYIKMTTYASVLERKNNDLIGKNTCTKIENYNNFLSKSELFCIDFERLSKLKETIKQQNLDLLKSQQSNERLKNHSKFLAFKLQNTVREFKKHQKPPLITLSEDKKNFRFEVGKASLTTQYKDSFLEEKFPELINNIKTYACNTIEIYGYTDTLAFGHNNIDNKLHECIGNNCDIDQISIRSNLELGMKRAISIVHFLKQQQDLGYIDKNIIIKPYSAGQFIDENGNISKIEKNNNKKRRRIEIRLSRSKQ